MLSHLMTQTAAACEFKWPTIPLDTWIDHAVQAFADETRAFFRAVRLPATLVLNYIESSLLGAQPILVLVVTFLIVWQLASARVAALSVFALVFAGFIGAWSATMTTMALILASIVFSALVGFIVGLLAAISDRFFGFLRPALDVMQTLPAFVYLVPVVMVIGIGNVPAVIVCVVFSIPPMIRLTNLGIREVPHNVVEAATAFGATRRQILFGVQIPLALPTILAGLNQCIMMALAMSTYAAMIGAGGLGELVLRGISRLDMGTASVGGIGIVLLAMILDRTTQRAGQTFARHGLFLDSGPIGLARSALRHLRKPHPVTG